MFDSNDFLIKKIKSNYTTNTPNCHNLSGTIQEV